MKKIYLIDTFSFLFRAYYAVPFMSNDEKMPTNALYGFTSMLIKLFRDLKPEYVVFCHDRKEASFRKKMYEEYKANRAEMPEDLIPQVAYLRQITEAFGAINLDKEDYEADDVIGSLARFGSENSCEVVIVSGDKDFAQLVSPKITMYDAMKNKTYDVEGVIEKWGIHPNQMIDYLALVGDSSDNIPGVRGVGPKGAQKMLSEYKTLDGIYENTDKISGKKTQEKIVNAKDMAYLSKELVTIVQDIDFGLTIDDLKFKDFNKDQLRELFQSLGFKSFEKKLLGSNGASEDSVSVRSGAKSKKKSVSAAKAQKIKDFKLEKWSLQKLSDKLEPYSEIWTNLNERGFSLLHKDKVIQVEAEPEKIGAVLEKKLLSWKAYNIKETWKYLKVNEVQTPAWDQMLAAYVARPGNIGSFADVYLTYTGKLPMDLAGPVEHMQMQLELDHWLKKKIDELDGESVLKEIELPLVPILYQMEKNGIGLDSKMLAKQGAGLAKDIESLEKEIFKISGETFNVASTKQLSEVLFNKMGITPLKKTKTGFSTKSDILEKLAVDHPICNSILEFRELSKLRSTYVDALPELVHKETGRIHTNFRQAATTTGRLSSVHPNLQNIPIRTERGRQVREAFVARKGHEFISADYSQVELRVLAHITQDKALLKAFSDDLDIHAATASEIFSVKLKDVSPDIRRKAKAVNFGIAYGQGAFGLSESLGISRHEASEIIEKYFDRFKNVREYMAETVEKAKADGYVSTLFGRRRYIPELGSSNGNMRKFGERAAINAPIQGTASDIVKKAMISVYAEVSAPMLVQVHDELLLECEKSELEEQVELVVEAMESAVELSVPLKVNVATGKNWKYAHA